MATTPAMISRIRRITLLFRLNPPLEVANSRPINPQTIIAQPTCKIRCKMKSGDQLMRYKTILLFGAPGSGKGTQGKILGSIPGFFHTACGDIFRSLDLQSEMGRIAWEYSSRGELVPDEFTVKLWKQYIKGMELVNQFHPETEILVLDGIPRNVPQAQLLEDT